MNKANKMTPKAEKIIDYLKEDDRNTLVHYDKKKSFQITSGRCKFSKRFPIKILDEIDEFLINEHDDLEKCTRYKLKGYEPYFIKD